MTMMQIPGTETLRKMLLMLAVLLSGCHSAMLARAEPGKSPVKEIYVVSHGWHAGIVIHRADIPASSWPEKRDFPDAEFLEIGWGDRDYYQAKDPGLGTTLKAALWPTPSVLHVVGFRGPVKVNFPHSEVVVLPVTRAGLARLLAFVDAAHRRENGEPATALGPGLYGNSRYYPAHGEFHLFNNCNRWTAQALRAAGYNVRDSITVGGLLGQLPPGPELER